MRLLLQPSVFGYLTDGRYDGLWCAVVSSGILSTRSVSSVQQVSVAIKRTARAHASWRAIGLVFLAFASISAAASDSVKAGDYKPLFTDGPLVRHKQLARLPNDEGGSCDHPDIAVTFKISPVGKAYGIRLVNASKDQPYFPAIKIAMSRWQFKPVLQEGFTDSVRRVRYDFRMKHDFYPCVSP